MSNRSGLGQLLSLNNTQRLSIADIHQYWNNELHKKAGHTSYQMKRLDQEATQGKIGESVSALFGELVKIGSWETKDGCKADGDSINQTLADLVKRGDLVVYDTQNPKSAPCAPSKIAGVNLTSNAGKYFIDRDDLGVLLVRGGLLLPEFWYKLDDIKAYQDRLSRDAADITDIRHQLAQVIEDNRALNDRLHDSMPYLDPSHPFFSAELEAAVTCWLTHYWDKEEGDAVEKKASLERWIKKNKADVVMQPDDTLSQSAIERIAILVNPNKRGGSPRKS